MFLIDDQHVSCDSSVKNEEQARAVLASGGLQCKVDKMAVHEMQGNEVKTTGVFSNEAQHTARPDGRLRVEHFDSDGSINAAAGGIR